MCIYLMVVEMHTWAPDWKRVIVVVVITTSQSSGKLDGRGRLASRIYMPNISASVISPRVSDCSKKKYPHVFWWWQDVGN